MLSREKAALACAQEMANLLGDDWIPRTGIDYEFGDYFPIVQNKRVSEIQVRKTDLGGFFVKVWIPYASDIRSVVQEFSEKMKVFVEDAPGGE